MTKWYATSWIDNGYGYNPGVTEEHETVFDVMDRAAVLFKNFLSPYDYIEVRYDGAVFKIVDTPERVELISPGTSRVWCYRNKAG